MSERDLTDSPVHRRAIVARVGMLRDSEPDSAAYNHSVLCQTSLPYRNPGIDVRRWRRTNGRSLLQIEAGEAPARAGSVELVPVGLPYGPRARLVLIHIMTQAILHQSPKIELDDSLTAFARSLGCAHSGRDIRTLRDQLRRLASCNVRMVIAEDGMTTVTQGPIVDAMQLFAPAAPGQRSLWPSFIQLSGPFYQSLRNHAVPLDPRALAALKHSAAALDCYQWLAQRLCRVSSRGQLIRWPSLHAQLGGNTKSVSAWKQAFIGRDDRKGTLPQVLHIYPAAAQAIDVTPNGLVLRYAAPPVPKFGKVQHRRNLSLDE